ncbi:hypothetical protein ZIOFF_063269 [Zingiber officinale]|uniref:Uncharacterized protein n=2 Tax=Zingiber officinale TaxID=94328 RepID=A0A8J5F1Q2_ZINOF|nr:hypothetical protein ZIOFF_063269 [Zingiber officinale]
MYLPRHDPRLVLPDLYAANGRCLGEIRFMEQYDKQYLKKSILKQEDTFRQQVHELHRLYRVQEQLMNEMNTNKKAQKDSRHPTFDLEHPTEKQDKNHMRMECQESDLDLTLATGSRRQKKKGISSCSDSGSSFSSSSTGSATTQRKGNEPSQFRISEIDMRFQHETHNQSGIKQNPWFSQCLSLS